MKKSEKIELRVNHDEKERLARIADRRGQTISDVVRDALEGELGGVSRAYPKWPGFVAIGALALASFAFLLPLSKGTYSPDGLMTAQLRIHPVDGPIVFETIVPLKGGFEDSFTVQTDASEFSVKLNTQERSSGIVTVEFEACKNVDETCNPLTMPSVNLAVFPKTNLSAQSAAHDAENEIVFTASLFARYVPPLQLEKP